MGFHFYRVKVVWKIEHGFKLLALPEHEPVAHLRRRQLRVHAPRPRLGYSPAFSSKLRNILKNDSKQIFFPLNPMARKYKKKIIFK